MPVNISESNFETIIERVLVEQNGFCKSAALDEIRSHDCVLTPGRYVGTPDIEGDDEPFEEKMARLTAKPEAQFAESARLEATIRGNLRMLEEEITLCCYRHFDGRRRTKPLALTT